MSAGGINTPSVSDFPPARCHTRSTGCVQDYLSCQFRFGLHETFRLGSSRFCALIQTQLVTFIQTLADLGTG